jgi:hypothetical protein
VAEQENLGAQLQKWDFFRVVFFPPSQIHIENREILLKLLEIGNVGKSQQISGNFPDPSSSHKAEPNLKYEAAEVNPQNGC